MFEFRSRSQFGSLTSVVAAMKAGFSALIRQISSCCLKAEDFDDLTSAVFLKLTSWCCRCFWLDCSGQLSGRTSMWTDSASPLTLDLRPKAFKKADGTLYIPKSWFGMVKA